MPATALISPSHGAQSQAAPADHQSPAGCSDFAGRSCSLDARSPGVNSALGPFLCNHPTAQTDIRDPPEGAITPTTSGWGGKPAPFEKHS